MPKRSELGYSERRVAPLWPAAIIWTPIAGDAVQRDALDNAYSELAAMIRSGAGK